MSPTRRFAVALLLALAPTLALAQGGNLTVTTLADHDDGTCDADCTLREAIQAANADGGPTAITFDPSLAGGTIVLASPLPQLVEAATTIDGDIVGPDCVPDIGLDGSALTGGVMLDITLAGGVVRGLALFQDTPGCESSGWGGLAHVGGSTAVGNLVECNSFGLDPGGAERPGHCLGIRVDGGAQDNRFERNRFTGAEGWAIYLEDGALPEYPEFAGLTPDLVTEIATLDLTDDCEFFKVRGGATFYDAGGHPFNENFGLRLTGQIQIAEEGDYTFALPGLDDTGRLFVKDETLVDWEGGGTPPPAVKHLEAGSHPIRLDFFEGGGYANLVLTVSGPQPVAYSTDGNLGGCAAGHAALCGELFQMRIPTERNKISQNQFWKNGRGIVTNCCCGPAVNDPGDLDLGPNTLLNTPVLESVTGSGTPGTYLVAGTAPAHATVEVFAAWVQPSFTTGEGHVLLGVLTADAGGAFGGPIEIPLSRDSLCATAIDAVGNTSEFSPPFATTDHRDYVTVADWGTELPDTEIEIPVYVRDQKLTLLGVDRPAGERIQGFAFKVAWEPAGAVALARFEPAGITAALTPITAPIQTQSGNTAGWVVAYEEATNPIPFTLDAPLPGDQVAKLVLTLAPNAPAGRVTLTLDPVTALHNQAGTIEETEPGGTLALSAGSIDVLSHAAQGLLVFPYFTGIAGHWNDPNSNEIGFRLERSLDGDNWETVAVLGPDDMGFQDPDRPPGTLHYYRVVTLVAGGDGQISNRAVATTHAEVAARICPLQLSGPRASTLYGNIAWNADAGEWAAVWSQQTDGRQFDLLFQRLAAEDLAPLAPPVTVVTTDMHSRFPLLRWNGSHYGLLWSELMRAEPGPETGASRYFFALLAADGSKVRGDVPLPAAYGGWLPTNLELAFGWDGSHWGFFTTDWNPVPFSRIVYYRLEEDGDVVLGPVYVTATADRLDRDEAAAFAPGPGLWGVAWNRNLDSTNEIWFQRLEESDGTLVGPAVQLGAWSGSADGVAIAWNPAVPPDGAWVVAWGEYLSDGSQAPLMLRMIAADGTVLGTAPTRLSDDATPEDPMYDEAPVLAVTSTGEVRAFTWSADPEFWRYEVGLLRADAGGNRLGSRIFLTPVDGAGIQYPHVAAGGDAQAVLFRDATFGPWEVSALRVDESALPGPQVWLTAGHTMAAGPNMSPSGLAPLGDGFVAIWTDRLGTSHAEPPLIHGRIVGVDGATVADLAPLSPTPVIGAPALAAVGAEFALAWRDAAANIRFARYDGTGSPLGGEAVLATGASTPVVLGFDGERHGVVFRKGGSWQFVSVWPDGTPHGEMRLLYAQSSSQTPYLLWMGTGWALVWRGLDSVLYAGIFDRDGLSPQGPFPVVGPPPGSTGSEFAAAYGGGQVLAAWTESLGVSPPGRDIYFATFDRNGTLLMPPQVAVSTEYNDSQPRLFWKDDVFHLFFTSGHSGWVHAVELADVAGGIVVQPGITYWTNRGSPFAVTTTGATHALAWSAGELHLMTGACLADGSRPPCPTLSAGSVSHRVRLSWPPVDDPDSGIWSYNLYRDGRMMAELFASTTQFDDGGFVAGATHAYQLRAMNGAFRESEGCPLLAYSTVRGDANGDGDVNGTDVFYLVNYFLAGGPPPQGDADANGSGGVTTGDIFYLINWLYAGGPAPEWSGETTRLAALPRRAAALSPAVLAPREALGEEATAERPRSTLALGKASARAGATIAIPVTLRDAAGTPLGRDRAAEDPIQALALSVNVLPAGAVTAIEVRRAGALAKAEPLFESRPVHASGAALVVSFDEAFAPLAVSSIGATTGRIPPATPIAEVVVTLARELAPGTVVELRLDPATTLLSNQAGTVSETAANGWLQLSDGRIEVAR